jgi:hypothetical protein
MRTIIGSALLIGAATLSLVAAVILIFVIRRSVEHPQFWIRESEPAPHLAGDHGVARFFRGYYLQEGRFGWSQIRLTRADGGMGWPFSSRTPPPPEQAVLLKGAAGAIGTPRTWSIVLWPLALGLALGGLGLSTVPIASIIRRRYRRSRGLCIRCGYDLRGTPSRCPECGAPSTHPSTDELTISTNSIRRPWRVYLLGVLTAPAAYLLLYIALRVTGVFHPYYSQGSWEIEGGTGVRFLDVSFMPLTIFETDLQYRLRWLREPTGG